MNRKELLKKFHGQAIVELPTPSIVADINAVDANLTWMDNFFTDTVCKLRPHFKSHKCVTLAKRQMRYKNCIGITCAKLSEAEQLVAGGIKDELQCGSYALMDSAYKKIRPEFLNARCILSTVLSVRDNTITLDVGLKGMGAEYGVPQIIGNPDAEFWKIAEEHTIFRNVNARIGDKILIVPPHGCTTNNLYPYMWIGQNAVIIDVWPVEGRGCLE